MAEENDQRRDVTMKPNSLREQALQSHTLLQKQCARAATLKHELRALEQSLQTTTSTFTSTTALLAQSECRLLCTALQSRLPRELREMVLSHLVPPTQTINYSFFRSTLDPVTRMHSYDAARWKAAHFGAHWFDAAYVGATFLEELVEKYYSTTTFVFSETSSLIHRFLTTPNLAPYPPAGLVSRIEVRLEARSFDRASCKGYMFGCATRPEVLVGALEGAEGLRAGASVVVRFQTRAESEGKREEQVKTACEVLVPRLWELRGAGKRLRLVVDGEREVEIEGDGRGKGMLRIAGSYVVDGDGERK